MKRPEPENEKQVSQVQETKILNQSKTEVQTENI